jgi:hypothetical protein
MGRKMNNKENLSFRVNSLGQEYIATCYPLPDRPGLEDCEVWKGKLIKSFQTGEEVEIRIPDILLAFPHLAGLAAKGFFETTSVSQYFERLEEEGAHDKNLYLFAKRVYRNLKPFAEKQARKIMLSVLDHANGCAVKPADLALGTVWNFGGTINQEIDQDYFGDKIGERYILVHGQSRVGPVAIRSLMEEEFQRYVSWFEKIQKSKDNPFNKSLEQGVIFNSSKR